MIGSSIMRELKQYYWLYYSQILPLFSKSYQKLFFFCENCFFSRQLFFFQKSSKICIWASNWWLFTRIYHCLFIITSILFLKISLDELLAQSMVEFFECFFFNLWMQLRFPFCGEWCIQTVHTVLSLDDINYIQTKYARLQGTKKVEIKI